MFFSSPTTTKFFTLLFLFTFFFSSFPFGNFTIFSASKTKILYSFFLFRFFFSLHNSSTNQAIFSLRTILSFFRIFISSFFQFCFFFSFSFSLFFILFLSLSPFFLGLFYFSSCSILFVNNFSLSCSYS